MSLLRKIVLTLIGLAVIAALAWGFRPQPIPAAFVEVVEAPLRVIIRETGRTRVKDRFQISAPVQAFAPRLELDAGDPVEAGQTLIVLEPVPATVLDPRSLAEARARVERNRAALQAAESRYEATRAQQALAQQELERLTPLHDQGTISTSQFDQAQAERQRLDAELRSARFDVEVARQDVRFAEAALSQQQPEGEPLQSFSVRSPVSGRVLQVHHESAGIVQPGEPLLCVADPASLEIVVEVLSADAVQLEPGMPVELLRWGGEQILLGEVRLVEPGGFTKVSALGVEEQRVYVLVDLTSPFEQWRALGDGYRVEAGFVVWQGEGTLQIPNGAVFRHDQDWAVFRVENNRAQLQPIQIGRRGEQNVQVLSGLAAGDSVIAHPDNEISDGVRVRPFGS